MTGVVTPERFATGMTFEQYVHYVGTPENLARESSGGPRADYSGFLRDAFAKARLTEPQSSTLKWLAGQPNGPAKMLVIAEEWSSDCRRDLPTFGRMAAETGMELRIFRRDGQRFSDSHAPTLAEAPDSNADIMCEFLNHKNGETWQSIPICAFYTRDHQYLYHYTEYPAIYEKDRVVGRLRQPKAGESPQETQARSGADFRALQESELFRVWASAAVDEMVSALHRRLVLGTV